MSFCAPGVCGATTAGLPDCIASGNAPRLTPLAPDTAKDVLMAVYKSIAAEAAEEVTVKHATTAGLPFCITTENAPMLSPLAPATAKDVLKGGVQAHCR